jgi:hypothetical protein
MSRLHAVVTQSLSGFLKEKDLWLHGILLLFLVFSTSLGTSRLILSYQHAQEVQQQIMDMQNFLTEWTKKTTLLNQAPYRPVKIEQMDSVQADLLLSLQANQLDLVGFRAIAGTKKDTNSKAFEMTFVGSYESTMQFLQNFHAKDALLSIYNLKMNMEKGKIKTVLQYKIYIK